MATTKKAKTIPGKWGQEQKIKARKRELESIDDSKNIPLLPDFIIKPLAKKMLKKEIKQLKSDSTYKEGKKWEKDFDKGWGKYEKGEHYSTPTNNNKNYKNKSKKKLIYT